MKRAIGFILIGLLFPIFLAVDPVNATGNPDHVFTDDQFVIVNLFDNEDFLNLDLEQLNNKSLKTVFIDNNKFLADVSNHTHFEPVPNWATLSNENNYLRADYTNTSNMFFGNKKTNYGMTLTNGSKYYLFANIFTNKSQNMNFSLRDSYSGPQDSNITVGTTTANEWKNYQRIATVADNTKTNVLQFQTYNSGVDTYFLVKDIKVIDLTAPELEDILIATFNTAYELYRAAAGLSHTLTTGNHTFGDLVFYVGDNVIVNLSDMFGAGNEPSAAVFENNFLIYAPDPFTVYVHAAPPFIDDRFVTIADGINYKTLDFQKSVIGYAGDNITIDFYYYDAGHFEYAPVIYKPQLSYVFNDTQYNVNWILVNELNTRYFVADLTQLDRLRIKTILFDRDIETGYLVLYDTSNAEFKRNYFMEIKSSTIFKINVESLYIRGEHKITNGNADAYFGSRITFYDRNGRYYGGSNILNAYNDEDFSELYTFSQRYTDINAFKLSFINYMQDDDEPTRAELILYEIALFATSQVFIPNFDIPDGSPFLVFETYTCGVFDVACGIRNLTVELSSFVYEQFGAETVAAGLMQVYDAAFSPLDLIEDSGIKSIVAVLYVVVPVGIIVMLVKRWF